MPAEAALQALRERVAAAHAAATPLCIRGGGSKDFLGGARTGALLELRGLSGIVDYEPSELVVSVRAGTPLMVLEALLASEGQYLAFEPPAFDDGATIGGAIAAGLAGPRRASAGGVRDFVLGAKLVAASGEVLAFGGRVMKNVAGFDVSRALCGSFGILGPIVELALKVLPRPACERTLEFELTAPAAVATFNRWSRRPLPVSATAWFDGRARVRLSGTASVVEAASRELGGGRLDEADAARGWDALRHHRAPFLAGRSPLWRLSVPATAPPLPLDGTWLVEWNGALRWWRGAAPAAAVHAAAHAVGGTATLWHGAPGEAATAPLPPAVLALHRRLKTAFDPNGIFNRGRLVDGL